MTFAELPYGPVKILSGKHKGRIVYYDSDTETQAICYVGPFMMYGATLTIPYKNLCEPTTRDLEERLDTLEERIGCYSSDRPALEVENDLLREYFFISHLLVTWSQDAMLPPTDASTIRIFISYSSKDVDHAKHIAIDLSRKGHSVWLDQWTITAGDSVPARIVEGIESCDAVVVILSPNSVTSGWVEREWQAKYWDEVERNMTLVIPVLLRECAIPTLLRTRKYADFRTSYQTGLEELNDAVKRIKNRRT